MFSTVTEVVYTFFTFACSRLGKALVATAEDHMSDSPCRGFFTVLLPTEKALAERALGTTGVCAMVARYRLHLEETSERMALLKSTYTLFLPGSPATRPCLMEPIPLIQEARFDPRKVLEGAGFNSSELAHFFSWRQVPGEGLERASDVLRLALAATHSLAYQDLDVFDLLRPIRGGPWVSAWPNTSQIARSRSRSASDAFGVTSDELKCTNAGGLNSSLLTPAACQYERAPVREWSNAAFCLTKPQANALIRRARAAMWDGQRRGAKFEYHYRAFGPQLFDAALRRTLPGPPILPRYMLRVLPCNRPIKSTWAKLAHDYLLHGCRAELLHMTCKSSHRLLACRLPDGASGAYKRERLIRRFALPSALRGQVGEHERMHAHPTYSAGAPAASDETNREAAHGRSPGCVESRHTVGAGHRGHQLAEPDRSPACQRLRTLAEKGLIFVHIPKNAGTSIETALLDQRPCTKERPCGRGRAFGVDPPSIHSTSADYLACDAALFRSVASAAILRRPLDRTRSVYRYCLGGGKGGPSDAALCAPLRRVHRVHGARTGFEAFVDWLALQRGSARSAQTNRTRGALADIFRPQSDFVLREDSLASRQRTELTQKAPLVTLLLCRESLQEDWAALRRLVPAMRNISLPSEHQRVSAPDENSSALDAPTPRTLQILESAPFFEADQRLWNRHCG